MSRNSSSSNNDADDDGNNHSDDSAYDDVDVDDVDVDVDDDNDEEDEVFCTDKIEPRKIKPQNIVIRLLDRQMGGRGFNRRPGTHYQTLREFYHSILPNLTVINVEKPSGYLRKFSPNGKQLISFSYDQRSLEIYRFNGVVAAGSLIHDWTGEFIPSTNHGNSYEIRKNIFGRLFKLEHSVVITDHHNGARPNQSLPTFPKQLNRECSLFTNDSRYVIVGASSHVPDESRPPFYEIYSNNETLAPPSSGGLENISLYMVDLKMGTVKLELEFPADKIILSHNQGVYLYNKTLAILSIQRQIIHIYEMDNGHLIRTHELGRFCSPLDYEIYESIYPIHQYPAFRERTINSLKHRILVYLYKMAVCDPVTLRIFYRVFDCFKRARMWKMQLLDEDHLLIKYTDEEIITMKSSEPNSLPCLFVFYNISNAEVLGIYDNSSTELLEIYENYTDTFRNNYAKSDMYYPSCANNNIYIKFNQARFKQSISGARNGGPREATRRILGQLPISSQSYSTSPYLDLSLFSYDNKWISVMERPKACCENALRFFGRDTGLIKFRIFTGYQDKSMQRLFHHHHQMLQQLEQQQLQVQQVQYQQQMLIHNQMRLHQQHQSRSMQERHRQQLMRLNQQRTQFQEIRSAYIGRQQQLINYLQQYHPRNPQGSAERRGANVPHTLPRPLNARQRIFLQNLPQGDHIGIILDHLGLRNDDERHAQPIRTAQTTDNQQQQQQQQQQQIPPEPQQQPAQAQPAIEIDQQEQQQQQQQPDIQDDPTPQLLIRSLSQLWQVQQTPAERQQEQPQPPEQQQPQLEPQEQPQPQEQAQEPQPQEPQQQQPQEPPPQEPQQPPPQEPQPQQQQQQQPQDHQYEVEAVAHEEPPPNVSQQLELEQRQQRIMQQLQRREHLTQQLHQQQLLLQQEIQQQHQTTPRLVAFSFHPTEPFAISVQRINNDYVTNFHIRNVNSEVPR